LKRLSPNLIIFQTIVFIDNVYVWSNCIQFGSADKLSSDARFCLLAIISHCCNLQSKIFVFFFTGQTFCLTKLTSMSRDEANLLNSEYVLLLFCLQKWGYNVIDQGWGQ